VEGAAAVAIAAEAVAEDAAAEDTVAEDAEDKRTVDEEKTNENKNKYYGFVENFSSRFCDLHFRLSGACFARSAAG
jgi:predicted phage-related endonuclease